MRKLYLALALCLIIGCSYKYQAGVAYDFPVRCSSCSTGLFDDKVTTIHCKGEYVLYTCQNTPCRHCGRMLAEPGDDVSMSGLNSAVIVTKRGQ